MRRVRTKIDLYGISSRLLALKQQDTTELTVAVYAHGSPYLPEDAAVTLTAVRADGASVIQNANISVSDNLVVITLDPRIVDTSGRVRLELLFLRHDDTVPCRYRISTFLFWAAVEPTLLHPDTDDTAPEPSPLPNMLWLATRAPYIGEDGHWYVYDGGTGDFTDSGIPASGGAVTDRVAWKNVVGKPETFPPAVHTHTAADISDLASVITGYGYQTADQVASAAQAAAEAVATINHTELQTAQELADHIYQGVDLTQKFSAEINATPYSGDVWAWIQARIRAHEYTGIHVNDFIPFATTNNVIVKACVAGIDTYYKYGDNPVPHHIDFISRDCWPTTVKMNLANYNNGLIPIEKLSGDGTTTAFTMTRQMDAIDNITVGGEAVTDFTYDFATATVTFAVAPATGINNITVTGTGTQHQWLASNAYAFLNSLAMQVPNGTGSNPAITQVDYTQGGIYHYLPAALKDVIVQKRVMLPARYSASGVLKSDNSWDWANAGNLWLPSEIEIAGAPIWGDKGYGAGGFVQYPIFACNMNRLKGLGNGGSRRYWWALSTYSGSSAAFVYVTGSGNVDSNRASYAFGAPICFRIA